MPLEFRGDGHRSWGVTLLRMHKQFPELMLGCWGHYMIAGDLHFIAENSEAAGEGLEEAAKGVSVCSPF